MNLPDAEYCGFCGKAIGNRVLTAIRKRKMDLVMIAMEMDLQILDECFQIVFKRILFDEAFRLGMLPKNKSAESSDSGKIPEQKPRKRGRKPKNT